MMIRSKLPMEDKLFTSPRGVTISTLTTLLLVFDVLGEIQIIWQKDKVVASRPRTAKCPRQNTTSCTMGASRAHTVHSLQNICVGHPILGKDKTDHSVRRGLRAPARLSSDPHGRQNQEYGLQAYDVVGYHTNNKHTLLRHSSLQPTRAET